MAYERYEWDPDEKQLQTNQPFDLAAFTAGQGMGTQAPATLPPAAGGVPGSRFIGFDRYLAANQDGSKRMADSLAGNVEKKGTDAQTAIKTAQDQFTKALGTPFAGFSSPTVIPGQNPANGYATAPAAGQGSTQGTRARAPAVTAPGAITREELVRRVNPTGVPGSLYDVPGYGAASTAVGAATNAANAATTPEGRQALLAEQYGKTGNYTAGMSRLDAALVGAGNGGRFDALGKRFGGLGGDLSKATAGSQAQRGAYDADTAKYRDLLTAYDKPPPAPAPGATPDAPAGIDWTNLTQIGSGIGASQPYDHRPTWEEYGKVWGGLGGSGAYTGKDLGLFGPDFSRGVYDQMTDEEVAGLLATIKSGDPAARNAYVDQMSKKYGKRR